MKALFFCLLILPLHANEINCPKGRLEIDLKNPVTSKRSIYCVLKKDGQYIKDGPEIIYDILGKVESENYYENGILGSAPKKEVKELNYKVVDSSNILDTVFSIDFSSDHQKMAVSSTEQKVHIFDLNSPKEVSYIKYPTLKNKIGTKLFPHSLAWSKDNNLLALGFEDGQMVIMNTLKGIPHATFDVEGNQNQVTTFLKFTDDHLLINRSGKIHYYETKNWTRKWKTEGDTNRVHINEKKNLLVTIDRFRGSILFKSLKNGKTQESYHLSRPSRRKTKFNSTSHDGKLVSSVEVDVPLSNKEKKEVSFAILKNVQTGVGYIADKFIASGAIINEISPDKRLYMVISSPKDENYDSELKVYDIKTKKLILEKLIPLKKYGFAWFSDNGRYLAYVNKKTNITVLDLKGLIYR